MEEAASISAMTHKSTLCLASFCKTISVSENLLRPKGMNALIVNYRLNPLLFINIEWEPIGEILNIKCTV